MKYLTFGTQEKSKYKLCILVNDIRKDEILRAYIQPYGLDPEEIIVISLHQTPGKKKTPKAEMIAYLEEEIFPVLKDMETEFVIGADGEYFKTNTGNSKVEALLGYI